MDKISIIVPVYNQVQYISRCLDSILGQTYKDLEIIVVDDGSSDNSFAICQDYVAKDGRIKLFHQENGGVSKARNTGLKNATGKWLTFVDGDDFIEPNCYERLMETLKENNADMIVCDFWENDIYNKQYDKNIITSEELIRRILKGKMHGSCCNKMIRKDIITDLKLCFKESITYCEDLLFNILSCIHKIKVIYLPEAFYHYEYTSKENHLSITVNDKQFNSLKELIKILQYNLKEEYSLKRQKEDAKRMAFKLKKSKLEVKMLYPEVNFDLILKVLPNPFSNKLDARLVRYMYF